MEQCVRRVAERSIRRLAERGGWQRRRPHASGEPRSPARFGTTRRRAARPGARRPSAPAHVAILSTSLQSSSGSSSAHLDEQPDGFLVVARDAAVGELLRHPFRHAASRDVVDEQVSDTSRTPCRVSFPARCRRVREHGVRSGARQVPDDRPSRQAPSSAPPLPTIDEPPAATEQSHRIAGSDCIVTAGRRVRETEPDAVLADPVAQPAERAVNLRPVAAGDQVDGFELCRHRGGQA